MNNNELAMMQLDGLISGIETNSLIPVQLSELKMLRRLLGGSYGHPSPPPGAAPKVAP